MSNDPIKSLKDLKDKLTAFYEKNVKNSGLSSFKGRDRSVKTPNGKRINTYFLVTDISKIIASHTENGSLNPKYPQKLQPRDRGRETSQAWVTKTANNLDPESLGNTSRVDTGAPIVGEDMVVESGNGRTMAIQSAYKNHKASEYKEWLTEEAPYFGLSAQQVKHFKEPILVRVRTTPLDREDFVIEANQDDKLTYTATERAKTDAKRIDDDLLQLFAPSNTGDILSVTNRPFLDGFMKKLGSTESAQYYDKEGDYTQSFATRIKQALFAKAYDDDRLLEMMADQVSPEMQNMINALTIATPRFIQAQAINKGQTASVTNNMVDGMEQSLDKQLVHVVIDATNAISKARRNNQALSDYVKQQGLFSNLPQSVISIAIFLVENSRSAKKISEFFINMAEYIENYFKDAQNFGLFGEPEPINIDDVVKVALDKMNKTNEHNSLF